MMSKDETRRRTIINLTSDSFIGFVKRPGISVVLFRAPWCTVCESFEPVFEEVALDYGDVRFARVDIEADKDLGEALEISHVPTLMIVRDGTLVFRKPGNFSQDELERIIDQARVIDLDELRSQTRQEVVAG
ncbi:thiol reductase thioredoxin [candidate division GN15 bacterium]|nr:thiol reductase thioredoxin [candidate division GN15 bacterium]